MRAYQRAMSSSARRALRWTLVVQGACWALIALFGFGESDGPLGVVQLALAATQLPGIVALTAAGWCCGFGGGFVISDVVTNRYGGLTLLGAPTLLAANLLLTYPVLWVAALLRERRGAGARRAESGVRAA
jgi:hypothetical protein